MRNILAPFFLLLAISVQAQAPRASNLVYVDGNGVLRYTGSKKEASFFGVNYTVPFAYGYRSHKALGVDIEKAIDADVTHFERLGLDAFRVHVWDVEISDSAGNLLNNEHLRLFDYLLMRLKQHHIKILITPIAFWGNGYPQPDEATPGFSTKYGKGAAVVNEEAIVAQERYLKQFFTHVNPYTKLTYREDPDVIATELNNEPHHSGPRERTTEYINRLAAAVRSTGWTKPVFYNISESPSYAGAVLAANVDGHSFQWYPTGLVAGHEQKGNFLPNVDQYRIPFFDSLPALKKRALMVYEFDAGDVLQSNMYPAMARSFRTAGFQWATQFAYDPMATAYANTEYQTHFLNLAYTPGKAVSLLIAGKAFHQLPQGKSWGSFPADTLFGDFRVSYANNLSEWNADTAFYYSNTTHSQPRDATRLRHIAGVGSSPVVQYEGYGAYFLDKLPNGNWRLELYPDPIIVADPFAKPSPARDVVRIHWSANKLQLHLPGLPAGFKAAGLDSANRGVVATDAEGILLQPGVYELGAAPTGAGASFFAPKAYKGAVYVVNQTPIEAIAGKSITIRLLLGGIGASDKVSVELRHSLNRWKTLQLQRRDAYTFDVALPSEMSVPGFIDYRILVEQPNGKWLSFPGGAEGNPYAWDNVDDRRFRLELRPQINAFALFNPDRNSRAPTPWISDWRSGSIGYTVGAFGNVSLRIESHSEKPGSKIGALVYVGDHAEGLCKDSSYDLVFDARASEPTPVQVSLVDRNGMTWSATFTVSTDGDGFIIPVDTLKPTESVLLPRPYPGFQPLLFRPALQKPVFDASQLDKVLFTFESTAGKPQYVDIHYLGLSIPQHE